MVEGRWILPSVWWGPDPWVTGLLIADSASVPWNECREFLRLLEDLPVGLTVFKVRRAQD